MAPHPVDVVIVGGGGPAGAAAARLLATWGHSVQLLTKTVDRSRSRGESLPPSCRKLFDLLGATAAIDTAGFLASSGNTVWWGDETTRTACFADGATGLQVERHDLDALLLRLAAQAGAHVQANALVRGARLAPVDSRPGPAAATISYATGDSSTHTIEAQFVLDCSGRQKAYGLLSRIGHYEFWTFDLAGRQLENRQVFDGRPRMRLQPSTNGQILYIYSAGNTIDLYEAATYRYLRTITLDGDMTTMFVVPD